MLVGTCGGAGGGFDLSRVSSSSSSSAALPCGAARLGKAVEAMAKRRAGYLLHQRRRDGTAVFLRICEASRREVIEEGWEKGFDYRAASFYSFFAGVSSIGQWRVGPLGN